MGIGKNNFDQLSQYQKAVDDNPDVPRALCFGDSWFQYVPHPTDLNKQLARIFKNTLFLNEGVAGRDSAMWKIGLPRIKREIASYSFKAILLSNGGNDIVGNEMREFVKEADRPQSPGSFDWGVIPPQVMDHIRLSTFQCAIQYAIEDLAEVVQLRDLYSRDSIIFVHTYAYIWPSGDAFKLGPFKLGPWVKPYLDAVGVTDIKDQRVITCWLIDQFYRRLQILASQHPNVRVIDSRDALPDRRQWENEIHPTNTGFQRIAKDYWVPQLTGILK
ncbi:hypothetical protein [Dyella japonica]|uniref:Lysophospholipase L1-like esterase n=1 Tax=Dyella japonica TaxID=231455 RepID=A0ABV2JZU5_9GAMM